MRVLLDEQYSPAIATELSKQGHDVTSVKGDAALEGLDDEPLLEQADERGRAILTNNVGDFARLAKERLSRGETHPGLIYTSDSSMPRARNTIGLYVKALGKLMEAHPGDDALRGREEWLTPA